jgi:O-antigen/teichoic acid export membrane protein
MGLFVFFFSLSDFVNCVFNAFNDFKANLIRSFVYEFSRLFLIISFVSIGLSVIGALLGFTIATFLAFLTLLALLIKNYGYILFGRAKSIDWRRVIRFTSYLTIGSITWVVFAYVDSIMIGMFLPAEYVGYYRASYNIVGAISGLVSIPAVLFPVFVQLEGQDLKNAFNRAFKYSSILSFPIAFGLPIISEPLIKFVYGVEYLPAVSVMWFLSFLILRSALGFWGPIFNAKEKPEYPVYVSFVAMILNIVLNYFMILRFGIVGAALATVIANIISWAILGYFSKRMFEIFPKSEYIIKPLVASLLMCYLLSNFELCSLFEGIVAITVGAVIYLVALFAFRGLTKDDFEYVRVILRV